MLDVIWTNQHADCWCNSKGTRRRLSEIYASTEPAYQTLMLYAGLDPDHGLLRWGNYDQTLLLPSTVFEPYPGGLRPPGYVWLI